MDDGTIYRQLRELVDTIPKIETSQPDASYTLDVHKWIGRLDALIELTRSEDELADLRLSIEKLSEKFYSIRQEGLNEIYNTLFRALARAELRTSIASKGSFVAVGDAFDALRALSEIMKSAKADVLIVDPYMDEVALSEVGILAADGVGIRLLSDAATVKPSLKPMVAAWRAQHGSLRPLEARLASPKTLHDRLIVIDRTDAWVLTQSLKDFAKRSPATLTMVGTETAALKIPAYENIWQSSSAI